MDMEGMAGQEDTIGLVMEGMEGQIQMKLVAISVQMESKGKRYDLNMLKKPKQN